MEKQIEKKSIQLERLLWSIAFPGFGQLLNHKFAKGFLFIALELLTNFLGNVNQVILLSFHGEIQAAITQTNYQWFMFYPCLYFFSLWDAYKDAGDGAKPFAYLPFVFSAFVATVGLIFSQTFRIAGYLFGPVWLPIVFVPVGIIIGITIKHMLLRKHSYDNEQSTKSTPQLK